MSENSFLLKRVLVGPPADLEAQTAYKGALDQELTGSLPDGATDDPHYFEQRRRVINADIPEPVRRGTAAAVLHLVRENHEGGLDG